METLLGVINLIFTLLWLAILARVLLSWFPQAANNAFGQMVFQLTEPILSPIRRFMPRTGMIDLTPLVAMILLWFLQALINQLIISA